MNTRHLGLITMITAPAMLVEFYRHYFQKVANADTDPIGAVLYALFSVGWFAALLGLRNLRATGESRFGRAIITLPLVTTALAVGQSFMDIFKVDPENPLYMVTDIAWPLSMVLTFIVSITVLFVPVLKGWHRYVPLFCGISLPLYVVVMAFTGQELPGWVFGWHTAVGWALLGYVVFAAAERSKPSLSGTPTQPALS